MNIQIQVSIPKVLVFIAFIGLAVVGFSFAPMDWREPIKFGGTLVAGTVAAYALILNVNYNRLATAAKFIERYNDPKQAMCRESVRSAINTAREGKDLALDDDKLAEVLNLFEEMSVLIEHGVADEAVLKAFFQTPAIECSKAMQTWLEKMRIAKNQQTAGKHFEAISNRWNT